MSLKSFFAKTFEHLFGAPRAESTQPSSKRRVLNEYARVNGHWVKRQLEAYDGMGTVIVHVPDGMPMKCGQSSVNSHIAQRFGKGKFKTRRFSTARTIHVRPITE